MRIATEGDTRMPAMVARTALRLEHITAVKEGIAARIAEEDTGIGADLY